MAIAVGTSPLAWKKLATESQEAARTLARIACVLTFALVVLVSYSFSTQARYSQLCGEITAKAGTPGVKAMREFATNLSASFCK
jgi:hypothetical protein